MHYKKMLSKLVIASLSPSGLHGLNNQTPFSYGGVSTLHLSCTVLHLTVNATQTSPTGTALLDWSQGHLVT